MTTSSTDADPSGFGVTYGYNGVDAPGCNCNLRVCSALYAQDEWQVVPKLKLTYGVRLEMPAVP
ncbi:MAG: hypothetical protein MZV63_50530 [Marinilabiliales bacterium]|nr:hypothetical protein [Marinilabiliales bacterium]